MHKFTIIVQTFAFVSFVTSQRPLINNTSPIASLPIGPGSLPSLPSAPSGSSASSSSSSLSSLSSSTGNLPQLPYNSAQGRAILSPSIPLSSHTSTVTPLRPNSIAIPPISYPSGRERLQKNRDRGYNKLRQFLTTQSPLGFFPPDRPPDGHLPDPIFNTRQRQHQYWGLFPGNNTDEPLPAIKKYPSQSSNMNPMQMLRKTVIHQSGYGKTDQSDDPQRTAAGNPLIVEPLQSKRLEKLHANGHFPALRPPPEDNPDIDMEEMLGVKCTFERECAWKWDKDIPDGFQVVTGQLLREQNMTGMMPGPDADPRNDAYGHFLHVRLTKGTPQPILRSPQFSITRENCYLEVYLHQSAMAHGSIRVVIEPLGSYEGSWVPSEIAGNDFGRWDLITFRIGRISKDFQILFEVVPGPASEIQRGHVSIDNLRMRNCFPEGAKNETCDLSEVKCTTNKVAVCIDVPRICDINVDCDENEDELLNCDKIPFGGRCDFESGWCGWHNSDKPILMWSRHSGPTPTDKTGPNTDHTYQHTNITGYYMYVNMNQHANDSEKRKYVGFASNAIMNSVIFNPPPSVHSNMSSPYRNSCMVRFHVHQFGMNAGSINLSVVEMREKENFTTTLWWSSKNLGEDWVRGEQYLPNITHKYFLQFEARMGMRIFSDVAVDDISLSPECFGLNIPSEHLHGYNYYDPRIGVQKEPHKDFENKTVFELTSCGARGIYGPTKELCSIAYNNTDVINYTRVLNDTVYKGIQVWRVPNEGYYTLIAKGAGGGLGSGGVGSSRGAISIAVLELHKNEELYVLVGQAGEHACIKSIGYRDEGCEVTEKRPNELYHSKTDMVRNIVIEDGAGGGGGGTFIFLLNNVKNAVPLLVAGGGGGLGIGRYLDDDFQHGQGVNLNKSDTIGRVFGETNKTAGPGGGWRGYGVYTKPHINYGAALLEGGRGGLPCYELRGIHGQGGFGGGGGGCRTGGGGGGYAGGSTFLNISSGEGGTSYIGLKRSIRGLNAVYEGANSGSGSVMIIPAVVGCGCDYRCVAMDEYRSVTQCICPEGWRLRNNTACELLFADKIPLQYWISFFAIISILLVAALSSLIFILYNRYQRRKQAALRHKMLLEQDLQLSRLRHNADDSALTNFNPNYGCDGILNGNIDVKTLPQVARESLRLVKALGQGAFGEVYQGLYRHRDGDAVEMPVAVKTLPELSTGQAETDFLMEAAIMAKFNHPNIVHLIGVCFDRHPRFIVLELLAGGDLKNFLREGRNKPERPSALTMKDLVFCALDVAKGCRYMESKRFIHRDIAARNCLLSSKGPGRVVKIADFGMARDIYRSDYYRKGGKAMLPIKWMPPEAFMDGIFTSKTDVWSFGVLLWEVFSLGLMPYTGLPNREVMNLVTHGGRLDSPPGCPQAIYRIMVECWNPNPEERPTFSTLLDQLTACTQDPEVMNAPLPSIAHQQASETDTTIVRPPCNDEFCLQVPNSSDYLIPLPDARSTVERLLNEATGVTLSETALNYAPPVVTSPPVLKCHDENGGCWETSFTMANSRSDRPLLNAKEPQMNGIDALPNHNNHNHSHNHNHFPHQNPLLQKKPPQHNAACQVSTNDDDYQPTLISLDTPQQTPTTIKPPISFAQMDGITLDPSALNKAHLNLQQQPSSKLSYANVQMLNSLKNSEQHCNHQIPTTQNQPPSPPNAVSQSPTEKMNGNGNSNSFDGSSSTISASSAPFAIQGFNDRYMAKENHSEISC